MRLYLTFLTKYSSAWLNCLSANGKGYETFVVAGFAPLCLHKRQCGAACLNTH